MDFLLKGNTLILIIFTMALLLTPWTDAQSKCVYVCVCYLNQGLQATTSKENSERLMNCVALVEKQTQVIVLQLKNKSFSFFLETSSPTK